MNAVVVDAPAKVNLRLCILSREESGYHSLESLFCALSLSDRVEIRRGEPGVRIAVTARAAYDLWLERNIRNAALVRTDTIDSAFKRFADDKLEALAGLRPRLLADAEALPGSRILDGKFTAVQQAVGTARANEANGGLHVSVAGVWG